ncbi:MAG: hypothetical protein HXY34_10530, partial [Candidatus Thorarchaeota archaeon]|nr:hypothetical protein [Candidatus Thorarchaeota archaeon]
MRRLLVCIKYIVMVGQRYQSYNLVDMRVQDINVVADLSRANPVDCDGTTTGAGEYVLLGHFGDMIQVPDKEVLMNEVYRWWTGPWPRLHTKIDYVTPDNMHVKYHVSNDMLGCMVVEEGMVLETNRAGDPIEKPNFTSQVASVYLHSLLTNAAIEMGLAVSDLACCVVCAGLEKSPQYWPAAVALGVAWTLMFIVFV